VVRVVLARDKHRQTILLFKCFIALLMAQEEEAGAHHPTVMEVMAAPEEGEEGQLAAQ
jgi:hypothetical protein